MKNQGQETMVKGLALVLVLCVLGGTVLAAHASGMDTPAPGRVVGSEQACYTLDTGRPEWSVRLVYLPLLLKGHE